MYAKVVLNAYLGKLKLKIEEVDSVGTASMIPRFSAQFLNNLLEESINELRNNSKSLVEMYSPVAVVGDIHGNLHDLLRFFIANGLPPLQRYIFLGDYVDRGEFSIECITLLLSLAILFPHHIVLIRGNHEVRTVNQMYGFKTDIEKEYGKEYALWEKFNDCFDYLPLACHIVNEKIFCVHGGIAPGLKSFNDISSIPLPIKETNQFIDNLLWSDPINGICLFVEGSRGNGMSFGFPATKDILEKLGCDMMIRGHQVVENGYKFLHGNLILSLFSSSNYCEATNPAAFAVVEKGDVICRVLPLGVKILRENVQFADASRILEGRSLTISLNDKRQLAKRNITFSVMRKMPKQTVSFNGLKVRQTSLIKTKIPPINRIAIPEL